MIDQLTKVPVLDDPSILSRILNFVRQDYLRECRGVNKLWRFLIDKILRAKTRVCVNELNVEVLQMSNTVLGLSLHIRWAPVLTPSLKNVMQKYCRYIVCLSWFLHSSEINSAITANNEGQLLTEFPDPDMTSLSFPCLKEIHFLFACSKRENGCALVLTDAILKLCPELESIRLETSDPSFRNYKLMRYIVDKKLAKLSVIHLGESVQLFPADLRLLTSLKPKLKEFTWEGGVPHKEDVPITESMADYDDAFPLKFMKSLETLKIGGLRRHAIPSNQFPLRCLSISNLNLVTIIPLSSQFPLLEELEFSFDSDFNWENWIPRDMASHPFIKSLKWLDSKSFSISGMNCFLRLFEKLPSLEKLSCPTNDHFFEIIVDKVPRLKKLELSGSCSDYALTGIPQMYCAMIYNSLASGRLQKTQSVLKPYRQHANICDLCDLEELTLFHTRITDETVFLAISVMKSLKKVYITGISMTATIELLHLPLLREIGVPQPLQGTMKFGDIVYLKETNPHIRIIAGWDSKDFPRSQYNCGYYYT